MIGSKQLFSSPYHPQTNGLTERFNKTLCKILKNYVNESNDNWDEYLETSLIAYNSTMHSSSKYVPYQAVFGRKVLLPLEVGYSTINAIIHPDDTNSIQNNINNIKIIDANLLKNIKLAQQKQKIYYDNKHTMKCFLLNDLVHILLKQRKALGNKFKLKRAPGIYRIVEECGANTFYICDSKHNRLKEKFNGMYLEHYVKKYNKNITIAIRAILYITEQMKIKA